MHEADALTIAASLWQGYAPLFLAQRQGKLDKRLIRLVEVPSNASSLRALSSGLVDGAALTLDEVLRARVSGIALTIVLVVDISAGADMLLTKPAITELAALRGKRIAIDQTTNGTLLLAKALAKAGIAVNQVVQVNMAIDDQLDAWQQNKIDAAISYDPTATKLLSQGAVRLFDTQQAPNTIIDVLAIRSDRLNTAHDAAVRHLIATHLAAVSYLHTQPKLAATLMAEQLGMPAEQVLSSFEGLLLPSASQNQQLLSRETAVLLTSAKDISAFMQQTGMLEHADDLRDLINPRYLDAEFPG